MRWSRWLVISVLLVLLTVAGSVSSVWAGTGVAVVKTANPYVVSIFATPGGREIAQVIVSGRPPETKAAVASVPDVYVQGTLNSLSEVPAFDWSYGCSATSAAMLFGYYDRTGFSNMYTGPTNGGTCPLNNSVWGHTSYPNVTCGECPLSATHQGVDGRTTRGHVDDYWINYLNAGPDPYIVNGWTAHTADSAADFMGTSQSGVPDGATYFYWYTSGAPLYDYAGSGYPDGCHGMRLFAESRGYGVTTNFSQVIQERATDPTKGFTFANFMAEIDAGRPVLIQVQGHTMLGYGYNTTGNIIYIHNTWDYSDHQMTWGGSYSGMQHQAVTVLRLSGSAPPPPPTITVASPNVGLTWQAGTSQTITWTYTGSPGSYVKIELLKNGVFNRTIASSASTGTGSYSWLIPSTQVTGSDYKVKISSTSNSAITDSSDVNFTITGTSPPTITVSAPNGAETWQAGTYQTIRWTYTGSPGAYVKIELFKGVDLNRTIASSASISTGSYSWPILSTQTLGDDYTVRVTSTSNSAITDSSNAVFTIAAPPPAGLTVTSPNGWLTWRAGTYQTITWTYTGSPGAYVKIELLKGGVVNRVITTGTSIGSGGMGSYRWAISYFQSQGTDYRIRITSTSNAGITDTSDYNFTISW